MSSSSTQSHQLARLGRSTYVSQRGLVQILKELNNFGLTDFTASRRSIKRARDDAINIDTTIGSLFTTKKINLCNPAKERDITIVNPCAMLSHLVSTNESFSEFLFYKLTEHPCGVDKPWRIVLYSDEVTFGNQLKPNNQRKVQAIYWSFAKLDAPFLSNEYGWFF